MPSPATPTYSCLVDMVPVASSNLAAVGYDPLTGELHILFQNGRLYAYRGVPPSVYDGLLNAASKGRYFLAHVRPRFLGLRIA